MRYYVEAMNESGKWVCVATFISYEVAIKTVAAWGGSDRARFGSYEGGK